MACPKCGGCDCGTDHSERDGCDGKALGCLVAAAIFIFVVLPMLTAVFDWACVWYNRFMDWKEATDFTLVLPILSGVLVLSTAALFYYSVIRALKPGRSSGYRSDTHRLPSDAQTMKAFEKELFENLRRAREQRDAEEE